MTPRSLFVTLLVVGLAVVAGGLGVAAGQAPGHRIVTTRDADTRGAYVPMDRATYLTLKKEIALPVLVERDPDLLNYIAVIRVNPARLPRVNAEGDWRRRHGGSS